MTKILVVEDDNSLREIYGMRIAAEGYTVVTAEDGEAGLAQAVAQMPDLIVSDAMMPKISGFEMLDLLKGNDKTRNIKVIMMTALSAEQQRERGQKLGADRYLVKSQVGIEDLIATIHSVLGDGQRQSASAQGSVEESAPAEYIIPAPQIDPRTYQAEQLAQNYQAQARAAQQTYAQPQAQIPRPAAPVSQQTQAPRPVQIPQAQQIPQSSQNSPIPQSSSVLQSPQAPQSYPPRAATPATPADPQNPAAAFISAPNLATAQPAPRPQAQPQAYAPNAIANLPDTPMRIPTISTYPPAPQISQAPQSPNYSFPPQITQTPPAPRPQTPAPQPVSLPPIAPPTQPQPQQNNFPNIKPESFGSAFAEMNQSVPAPAPQSQVPSFQPNFANPEDEDNDNGMEPTSHAPSVDLSQSGGGFSRTIQPDSATLNPRVNIDELLAQEDARAIGFDPMKKPIAPTPAPSPNPTDPNELFGGPFAPSA